MVRRVDHESRRREVLAQTIDKYIKSAAPVSSEELSKEFGLSSATLRNILAELEEAGYLTHPHTSGGRVPTLKGYRYYIDFLLKEVQLLEEEKQEILHYYQRAANSLEKILEMTTELISQMTHYTGIVSFLEWQDRLFYHGLSQMMECPEFRAWERLKMFLRLLDEREIILDMLNRDITKRLKVYLGDELGCSQMKGCALVVSSYGAKGRMMGNIAVLGPLRMEYARILSRLSYISDVLGEFIENFYT